jgi:hypothetical protein
MDGDIHWTASIVEAVRVDGKPRQRHIACVGSLYESELKSVTARGVGARCR